MHQTADTSLQAYKRLDATDQYELILNYLRSIYPGSSCIADIATALEMERSTVSARLNELKQSGQIVYDGKRPSERTGINAMHWKIKSNTLF
jgi:DNA-binding IclR family transcriptional regulator